MTITQTTGTQLVDFPVSIVTTDDDLALHARPDGRDIQFTDATGTMLPHEVVAYADGALEAWVRVTLDETTKIQMIYGVEPTSAPETNTWSSSFEAVWHLAETNGGARDSTGNDYDLDAATEAKTPASAAGKVGNARAFTDSTDPSVRHGLCASPTRMFDMAKESFSFSAWINAGPLVGSFSQPFAAGGFTDGTGGFAFEMDNSVLVALVSDNPGSAHLATSFLQRPLGRWSHLAGVVDRANAQILLYLDGFQANVGPSLTDGAGDVLGNVVTEAPICVGAEQGYAGLVDEVRVYNTLITPEWIRAEFKNVDDRETFVRIDP